MNVKSLKQWAREHKSLAKTVCLTQAVALASELEDLAGDGAIRGALIWADLRESGDLSE